MKLVLKDTLYFSLKYPLAQEMGLVLGHNHSNNSS
ncbi:hypothetical protein SAMN05421858_3444 [Haladaptatus litoreus]|uniref:Uncharacterized protein n=1 Tax=Haladaptatus litoreus TaxID=553468 RepID=A0A1N7D9M8_9EURY|nr:hypothetical protein SAMN05421858_3444 [Haladaptatus litoreus]